MTRRGGPIAVVVGLAVALVASGCTSQGLSQGDLTPTGAGQVTEYSVAQSRSPVQFSTSLLDGSKRTAEDYRGKVLVVNFWYASCPPCRAEANDLQKLSVENASTSTFLGVDVRDDDHTAAAFLRTFKVRYDTVSDVETGAVQLAFAGTRGPNATPTTIVVDPTGRVSARILGGIDPSTLRSLIKTAATRT